MYTQIDREYYGQMNTSSLFTGNEGESPEVERAEQESSNALMTRLTKFIYNATNVPDIERCVGGVTVIVWCGCKFCFLLLHWAISTF